MASSYYRQQLEAWLKTIDVKAGSVLDVGGAQEPIKDRIRSWDVKDYKILDIAEPHKCKQKPDIICDLNKEIVYHKNYTQHENCIDIIYLENKFNIIFCLEVAEYLFDPLTAIRNLNSLLVIGGILYMSFPFVYPTHEPAENDYLRYTKFGVEKLLTENGFEIEYNLPRLATSDLIEHFYSEENMRYKGAMRTHTVHDIGYLVKAIKK